MSRRVFLVESQDGSFERSFSRERAVGHTGLEISEEIGIFDTVNLKTESKDDKSFIKVERINDESTEDENEIYTILCKEFGLIGGDAGFKSEISVILCDNGYMLVTLHKGAVIVTIDGKLQMPNCGVSDEELPQASMNNIFWVTSDKLVAYAPYMGTHGKFIYDFELFFIISGCIRGRENQLRVKFVLDKDIDLSLGHVARYEQQEQIKAGLQQATKIMAVVGNQSQGLEFDDPDDDDDEMIFGDDE